MRLGRLEAFSDGVFAVAITLLALDLVIRGPGHGPLAEQLTAQWPAYLAYIISFFTIGVIWVNHHVLFDQLTQIDRTLLFLNLLLLLFVVTIPFATSTMAGYLTESGDDAHLATALYGAVMTCMAISFGLILDRVTRRIRTARQPRAGNRLRAQLRFSAGAIVYLTAAGIAFLNVWIAITLYGLTAAYYVLRQTPDESSPTAKD